MNTILRSALLISGVALATPAMAWTTWNSWPDFEWYADVGRTNGPVTSAYPAPRAGYIWAPGRHEWNGERLVWMPGAWIVDDYERESRAYAYGGAAATAQISKTVPSIPGETL